MSTATDSLTTLYRFFNADGVLLYVGITGVGGSRWGQHAAEKAWWCEVAHTTTEHFATREEAAAAELAAIKAELPRHNIIGTGRRVRPSSLGPDHAEALRRIRQRRERLELDEATAIRAAIESGASLRDVAAEVGRTKGTVDNIVKGSGKKRAELSDSH